MTREREKQKFRVVGHSVLDANDDADCRVPAIGKADPTSIPALSSNVASWDLSGSK